MHAAAYISQNINFSFRGVPAKNNLTMSGVSSDNTVFLYYFQPARDTFSLLQRAEYFTLQKIMLLIKKPASPPRS